MAAMKAMKRGKYLKKENRQLLPGPLPETNLQISGETFWGLPVIYKVQKQALNFYRILMGRSDFIVLIIFFQ